MGTIHCKGGLVDWDGTDPQREATGFYVSKLATLKLCREEAGWFLDKRTIAKEAYEWVKVTAETARYFIVMKALVAYITSIITLNAKTSVYPTMAACTKDEARQMAEGKVLLALCYGKQKVATLPSVCVCVYGVCVCVMGCVALGRI